VTGGATRLKSPAYSITRQAQRHADFFLAKNPAADEEGASMRRHSFRLKAKGTVRTILLLALTLAIPPALAATSKKGTNQSKGGTHGGGGGHNTSSGWQDDFNGPQPDTSFWIVANGQAPGYIPGYHIGYYDSNHVHIVGDSSGGYYLQMLLTQATGPVDSNPTGIVSDGAMIYTKNTYQYGTFEMRMRMSSTSDTPSGQGDSVSGSVSAGFLYVNNSQTEIDFEFSALDPKTLYMVNWLNPNPQTDPTEADETFSTLYPFTVSTAFHDYKFVWQPGEIDFYVDGTLKSTHTTNVPSAAANFMINHWGTDGPNWGGYATTGTTRYFYVDWVKYTPLK
jgi:beta-glucanase (GH16 family)